MGISDSLNPFFKSLAKTAGLSRGADALDGRVLSAAYLGDHIEYEIETPVGRLFIVDPAIETVRPIASAVGIGLHERGVAVLPA